MTSWQGSRLRDAVISAYVGRTKPTDHNTDVSVNNKGVVLKCTGILV
jgi:hypothetical protein